MEKEGIAKAEGMVYFNKIPGLRKCMARSNQQESSLGILFQRILIKNRHW